MRLFPWAFDDYQEVGNSNKSMEGFDEVLWENQPWFRAQEPRPRVLHLCPPLALNWNWNLILFIWMEWLKQIKTSDHRVRLMYVLNQYLSFSDSGCGFSSESSLPPSLKPFRSACMPQITSQLLKFIVWSVSLRCVCAATVLLNANIWFGGTKINSPTTSFVKICRLWRTRECKMERAMCQ